LLKPSDIVAHLGRYLPRVTDLFSEKIGGSATVSGSTLTVTTDAPHNLAAGHVVTLSTAVVAVPIVGATLSGETVIFDTAIDHDLTEPRKPNDMREIELSGFTDDAWNTKHDIKSVPNRFSFGVSIPDDVTSLTLNGNERLLVERSKSVLGMSQISNIIDPNTFEIEIPSNTPTLDGATISEVQVTAYVRVAGVSTLERAEEIYTKYQADKLWAFVMMTDADVSKDRHSINDGVATFSTQDAQRLRILNNFSIIVFFPSRDSLSGASRQELAYGEVYTSLLRVLYGFDGFSDADSGSKFVVVGTGHGPGQYNAAYYTHVYDWQFPEDVTAENGWNFYESVAFRDIHGLLPIDTVDNPERYTLAINLDEQP
jgi:hypothetical protein